MVAVDHPTGDREARDGGGLAAPVAFTDAGGRNLEHRDDSEPRPQRSVERLVWLAHGLTVMVAWLVAVPFVLIFVAVGFIMEALFGMRLQRSNDSDGTDLARWGFDEAQVRASLRVKRRPPAALAFSKPHRTGHDE